MGRQNELYSDPKAIQQIGLGIGLDANGKAGFHYGLIWVTWARICDLEN